MNEQLLSIIIPVYNCENYITQCVESIRPELYKKIEVILINDGSKDSSLEICNTFKKKYDNIILFSTENKGVSHARNIGIKNACGKWIMFVDSDDYLEVNAVEKCLNFLDNNETELFCFGRCTDLYDESGKELLHERKETFETFAKCEESMVNFNIRKDFSAIYDNSLYDSSWGKCFLRSVLLEHNIKFNYSMTVREDSEFVVQYFKHIDSVQLVTEYWYHYRIIGNENKFYARRRINIEDIKKFEDTCRDFLKVKQIETQENSNMISRQAFMLAMGGVMQLCSRSYNHSFKELFNYSIQLSNMFSEMLKNMHYGALFYDILITLLQKRQHLLFCMLCKFRLFNSFE